MNGNDGQPIYRQLRIASSHDSRRRSTKAIMPVHVAAEFSIPLTVLKPIKNWSTRSWVEKKRGLGMFVKAGARNLFAQRRTPEISCRALAQTRPQPFSGSASHQKN